MTATPLEQLQSVVESLPPAQQEDVLRYAEAIRRQIEEGGDAPSPFMPGLDQVIPQSLLNKMEQEGTAREGERRTVHPLLNWPNRLGQSDWADWVQERGLYFPSEYDQTAYTALLKSGDPGEAPLSSGYLVADFGMGSYIYTSYVWYRQLRNRHPGAFRAFANMLSYPGRPR